MELDRETLEKAAAEALERPSNAMFWDDRLFATHGAVMSWAELGDDILDESNYLTALAEIQGAAGDDADEHVIDGTSRHWACGSLRTIYVQVYEGETSECSSGECWQEAEYVAYLGDVEGEGWCSQHIENGLDRLADDALEEAVRELGEDSGDETERIWKAKRALTRQVPIRREFTPAFIKAVELALYLKGGGAILDDSDYSEREWKVFEEALSRAVEWAQRDYCDTPEEDEAIAQRFYEDESATHRNQWCRAEDVSWEVVAEEYKAARDEYFLEKATETYRWNVLGYNPDQLELFAA